MKAYKVLHYQKQKPFSGFLPGISGPLGIPMWSFYVNRGQAIASFGVRDKNGSLMEFYPANLAYAYTSMNGFRTFVKLNGMVKELFLETDGSQSMEVEAHQITLTQTIEAFNIVVKVTYATLPNAPIAGLLRKVSFTNLDEKEKHLEIIDGLTQFLPSGIDHGASKSISNLLQSWMQVDDYQKFIFLKLRASTADSSEVNVSEDGHFYHYQTPGDQAYIYDYKVIFNNDTTFKTPYGFIESSFETLKKSLQTAVNQVPSGFVATTFTLKTSQAIYGIYGYASKPAQINDMISEFSDRYFDEKFQENYKLIKGVTETVLTKTAEPMFDDYIQQCMLDNVLRGGLPIIYKTLNGPVAYHIYSRKHGDLERDYNFFSLEPKYLSQGNGAFRDVLQNRRNDLFIEPRVKDVTIRQFISFLQADGYNPLSVEGIKFTFKGDIKAYDNVFKATLSRPFSPGEIATIADSLNLNSLKIVEEVIAQSTYEFVATFGEGYWQDHFTYILDLIETFNSVYPDNMDSLLFDVQVPYFVSPARVKPRNEKYVLKNGQVRQYHSLDHRHDVPVRGWLTNEQKQVIETSIFAKLLTLAVSKFASLDPESLGLMYEAEKPGWNDAMNGLPGVFGSGVSELFELKKIVAFLLPYAQKIKNLKVLESFETFVNALMTINYKGQFADWDLRVTALESYRESLASIQRLTTIDSSKILELLKLIDTTLSNSVQRIEQLGSIIPTYLSYQAVEWEELSEKGQKLLSSQGYPFVKVRSFKRLDLPKFLEGPARYLSTIKPSEIESRNLYHAIKQSSMYDHPLKLFKTSESLDEQTMEIGRIRAFTPGWLERESDFLHMSYKFLLGLSKANLYDEFFAEIRSGLTCFMNPEVYGRSPLENSSFIATSNNPDPTKHGQGFFARLSGSTAEVLSMWKELFLSKQLFSLEKNELIFKIQPKLPADFFDKGVVESTLFSKIKIVIHYQGKVPTYDPSVVVEGYELKNDTDAIRIPGQSIQGTFAHEIRELKYSQIHVYLKGGT